MDQKELPTESSPKAIISLIGANKTIRSAEAYKLSSTVVVELSFDDGTSTFLKMGPNGALEIGGTAETGTGAQVSW